MLSQLSFRNHHQFLANFFMNSPEVLSGRVILLLFPSTKLANVSRLFRDVVMSMMLPVVYSEIMQRISRKSYINYMSLEMLTQSIKCNVQCTYIYRFMRKVIRSGDLQSFWWLCRQGLGITGQDLKVVSYCISVGDRRGFFWIKCKRTKSAISQIIRTTAYPCILKLTSSDRKSLANLMTRACLIEDIGMLKRLYYYGGDLYQPDRNGDSVASLALTKKNINVLKAFANEMGLSKEEIMMLEMHQNIDQIVNTISSQVLSCFDSIFNRKQDKNYFICY